MSPTNSSPSFSGFNLQFFLGLPSLLLIMLGGSSIFLKTPSISLESSKHFLLPMAPSPMVYDLIEEPVAIGIEVPLDGLVYNSNHHYSNSNIKHRKRVWKNFFEEPERYALLKVPLINNLEMIRKLKTIGSRGGGGGGGGGSWIPPPLQRILFRWWQWLEGDVIRFSRIYSELPVDICIQISSKINENDDVDWSSSPIIRDVENYRLSAAFQEIHGGEYCFIRIWTEWGVGIVRPDISIKEEFSNVSVIFEKAIFSGSCPISMIRIIFYSCLLGIISGFTIVPLVSSFMEDSISPLAP